MTIKTQDKDQNEIYLATGSGTGTNLDPFYPALSDGAATDAKLDDLKTLTGAVNESAPGTDTASSGLNGRLQRIAQRLTSLIDSFTNGTNKIKLWDGTNNAQIDAYSSSTLSTDKALKTSTVMHGLSTAGGGIYVDVKVTPSGALAVDATLVATGLTPALTSVGDTATSTTVLASNSSRKGAVIVNDSTAILYLKLGATASATSYTFKMQPDDTVIINSQNLYTGIIDGIWASDAGGNARVTELT
jgi:hypothetical protein